MLMHFFWQLKLRLVVFAVKELIGINSHNDRKGKWYGIVWVVPCAVSGTMGWEWVCDVTVLVQ